MVHFLGQYRQPPQAKRLLPSTAENAIWPVLPEGCTARDSTTCPDSRGTIFKVNESSTWSEIGLFELGLSAAGPLRLSGNARFGFDEVRLGVGTDPSVPLIKHQVIEGIATKDFFLGTIGLGPNAINITSFSNSTPSFLSSLKSSNAIPSLSWGYTAGAWYTEPPAFGSLILGGFDDSRFVAHNLTFPFSSDINRELLVNLQSIHTDLSTTSLMTKEVYALIDSLISEMWLPVDVCRAFESTFGLFYNQSRNLYFTNDTTHDALLSSNPNTTLTLNADPSSAGQTFNITMPYKSFDLVDSVPSKGNGSHYFPLRQATNSTQYRLGRAFLQSAYLVADFERRNFSVYQALYPDLNTKQNIISIDPILMNQTNSRTPVLNIERHHRLSKDAVVGIAIGVPVFLLALGTTALGRWRNRRRVISAASTDVYQKPELHGKDTPQRVEAPADNTPRKPELSEESALPIPELTGDEPWRPELTGQQ